MSIHQYLPAVLTASLTLAAALVGGPVGGSVGRSADTTVPAAFNPASHADPHAHPHPVRKLALKTVRGEVSLTYRTVDFNPEHKAKIEPGMEWHMAYGTKFTNGVPLSCGNLVVPEGTWHISTRRAEDSEAWHLLLRPDELYRGIRQEGRRLRQGGDTDAIRNKIAEMRAELEKRTLVLPTHEFANLPTDHMQILLADRGYEVTDDGWPKSGSTFEIRVAFGDLRCGAQLHEILPEAPTSDDDRGDGGRRDG